jgi:hypothetical protein
MDIELMMNEEIIDETAVEDNFNLDDVSDDEPGLVNFDTVKMYRQHWQATHDGTLPTWEQFNLTLKCEQESFFSQIEDELEEDWEAEHPGENFHEHFSKIDKKNFLEDGESEKKYFEENIPAFINKDKEEKRVKRDFNKSSIMLICIFGDSFKRTASKAGFGNTDDYIVDVIELFRREVAPRYDISCGSLTNYMNKYILQVNRETDALTRDAFGNVIGQIGMTDKETGVRTQELPENAHYADRGAYDENEDIVSRDSTFTLAQRRDTEKDEKNREQILEIFGASPEKIKVTEDEKSKKTKKKVDTDSILENNQEMAWTIVFAKKFLGGLDEMYNKDEFIQENAPMMESLQNLA